MNYTDFEIRIAEFNSPRLGWEQVAQAGIAIVGLGIAALALEAGADHNVIGQLLPDVQPTPFDVTVVNR